MKKQISIMSLMIVAIFAFSGMAVAAEPIDAVKANIKLSTTAIKQSVPTITVQEFMKKIESDQEFFEVVDVRGKDEYDAGHLANVVWAPRGKAEWVIPTKITDPDVPIYIYCKSGTRGALVTKMLLDAGYTNVTNVDGGFKAWASAGYPFYNLHGRMVMSKDGFGKQPQ